MAVSTKDAPWPIGMDRFQQEVGEWANQTFTQATDHSIIVHLAREVKELRAYLTTEQAVTVESIALEAADCLLLLMHLAHRCDFSLIDAATLKHSINRHRQWGQADAEGVVEHVRD